MEKPSKGEDSTGLFLVVPQNFHHHCVESFLLIKVGWDEVFRFRTVLLLLANYAAGTAKNHVSKHHLWKQTALIYTMLLDLRYDVNSYAAFLVNETETRIIGNIFWMIFGWRCQEMYLLYMALNNYKVSFQYIILCLSTSVYKKKSLLKLFYTLKYIFKFFKLFCLQVYKHHRAKSKYTVIKDVSCTCSQWIIA